MTTRDLNFMRMAAAVEKVLDRYANEWKDIARFAGYVAKFKEQAGLLNKTISDAAIETTGATEDKHAAAAKAIASGVKLAKRASIYAIEKDNMELHDQLRISRSSLLNRHDKEAIAKLRDVLKRMRNLGAELEEYFVSKKELDRLHLLIEDFNKRESAPRDRVLERQGRNESIPGHLNDIRKTLYKMDSMINIFEDTPLEAEYLLARKVIDLGGRYDKDNSNKKE